MKKKKIIILFLGVAIVAIYTEEIKVTPLEEYNVVSSYGIDITKDLNSHIQYNSTNSIYNLKNQEAESSGILSDRTTSIEESIKPRNNIIISGKRKSIGETREERQIKSAKPILFGVHRIILMGEQYASNGILDLINLEFANPEANDRGVLAVCKGKAEDMQSLKIEGYPSSADYIQEMIQHATNFNFIAKKYTLLNMFIQLDSEGRNVVLPYIEIKNNDITFSGMAIFNGDKMVFVLPMEESRIMNILREKDVKGVLSLQESPKEYLNYDTTVKKKVICNKVSGKYEFNIDLNFQGDIMENTLYRNINKKSEKQFEDLLTKKIEEKCNAFIEKMKNVYKLDLLELGSYAAAKYGRDSGIDWNKEISNSEIKVNVKVKIDKVGIGQY